MGKIEIEKILGLAPELLELPYPRIWTTYDKEVDGFICKFQKAKPC